MNLNPFRKKEEARESYSLQFQDWVEMFNYAGSFYPLAGMKQTIVNGREEINDNFTGLALQAYMRNAVVYACMQARLAHFTEARMIFRKRVKGRAGELHNTPATYLDILEHPWPGGTTGDLLGRMIQDADLAGNAYIVRQGNQLARLRPDWVAIVLGSRSQRREWVAGDPDTEVAGYLFFPGGQPTETPMAFVPEQICHFAPNPDPIGVRRGMSWLTPLIREIQADSLMTSHKTKYLENGATVNLVVTLPEVSREKFNDVVQTIRGNHEGSANAYRTLFLMGGADAKALGGNMQETDFRAIQGAGETRICSAARVPAVIAQISEGLQGSSLNSGNYQSARRMFADGELRRLWRNAAGSLARVVTVPNGSELWYDDRDIAFLKEDLKDIAEVQAMTMNAAKSAIDAGFEPDAIVRYLQANDLGELLNQHTGLSSVQLQPPASGTLTPTTNGHGTITPKQLPPAN